MKARYKYEDYDMSTGPEVFGNVLWAVAHGTESTGGQRHKGASPARQVVEAWLSEAVKRIGTEQP